jgi:hypothetical protein
MTIRNDLEGMIEAAATAAMASGDLPQVPLPEIVIGLARRARRLRDEPAAVAGPRGPREPAGPGEDDRVAHPSDGDAERGGGGAGAS